MAVDLTTAINDFVRDAQYRIAELSVEIDENRDNGQYRMAEALLLRHELSTFVEVLWWSRHPIIDGSNFLAASEDWTDAEITREIHRLRNKGGLNPVPYISFAGYNPEIISQGDGSGGGCDGSCFPQGTLGQYLAYDGSGTVIAQAWPEYVGANPQDDIFDYFENRA